MKSVCFIINDFQISNMTAFRGCNCNFWRFQIIKMAGLDVVITAAMARFEERLREGKCMETAYLLFLREWKKERRHWKQLIDWFDDRNGMNQCFGSVFNWIRILATGTYFSTLLVNKIQLFHIYTILSSVAEPKLFIFGSGSDFDHNFGSGSSYSLILTL